jgi:hypothetical protein
MYGFINSGLNEFRAVMLHGARQSGKSTLARQIAYEKNAPYVNLDFPDQRDAALAEPVRFVSQSQSSLMVIDEVQRGGQDLLLAIKTRLDQTNRPGQFLLTGSANFLTLPTVSESLQGRIAVEMLHPFAQSELTGSPPASFVDAAFSDPESLGASAAAPIRVEEYWELIATGGYPEVQGRGAAFQAAWFRQYVETAISREVIDLGNISDRSAVIRVLNHCAAASGRELNLQALAKSSGLSRPTISRYLAWLESAHLIALIPAWRRSLSQRQIKSAKLLVSDSGLACHLAGKDAIGLSRPRDVYRGQVLETFVGNEIRRILGWSETRARIHHFRTVQGAAVDFVLEAPDGRVIGVEVKTTTSPGKKSGHGLGRLRDAIDKSGGAFVHGFVIHLGDRAAPLGDRISALPLRALWMDQVEPRLTTLRQDSATRSAHIAATERLAAQQIRPAIAISVEPRYRRTAMAFNHDSRELTQVFSRFSNLGQSTIGLLNVQRDYLSYRVVDTHCPLGEFVAGQLHLDGSCSWLIPILTDRAAIGGEDESSPAAIRPLDLALSLASGLRSIGEWSVNLCEIEGDATVGVQLLCPPPGLALSLGPYGFPRDFRPRLTGLREVQADLAPLAIDVEVSTWVRDSASMMGAVRFLGEHLLAAFGYEGLPQIDESGRFAARGIGREWRSQIVPIAATLGVDCDWLEPESEIQA